MKWELRKLFSRSQTRFAFAAFLTFEVLLLLLLQHGAVRDEVRRTILRVGFTFPENFTGPTIADFVMSNTMNILGNLQVALVAGEIVAREIDDGTMRMLFCRPVRRGRVFAVKLLTTMLFTGMVTSFIAISALVLGLSVQGPGYWLILSPKEEFVAHHEFWPGLVRYFAGTALMTVGTSCLTGLALMLSCLKFKPVAAAITALTAFLVDDTLRNLPFFASVKEHFVMSHIAAWLHIYDRQIPWGFLARNEAFLLALNAAFVTIGWLAFKARDLKP